MDDLEISDSVFTIQIFDHRKRKKGNNQGYLGLVNILMSDVFDIDNEDENENRGLLGQLSILMSDVFDVKNEDGDKMLTLDLKKGTWSRLWKSIPQ